MKSTLLFILGGLCLLSAAGTALAQGTAFTYQGLLNDGGSPANGSYDLTFGLWNSSSGPTQLGSTITNTATVLSNGAFSVTLDFGANFPGANRWVEIGVRTNGNGTFMTLSPRQKITSVPYAITASNLSGTLPNANLSGTYSSAVTLNNTANQYSGNGGGLTNVTAVRAGTATNFSGNLGGNVTGMQSSTVVTTVGGQTAANVAAGVLAANTATDSDNSTTIVKRDGSGNFSTDTITLDGNLVLPPTTTNTGFVYSGGSTLLHILGLNNFFAGVNAGNLALTGNNDTGTGAGALGALTSGTGNAAAGSFALAANTTGMYNTAVGDGALRGNQTGNENTAVGEDALNSATGSGNIALGFFAGLGVRSGGNNIEIGNQGFSADNNTIRLGTQTTQSSCFIAGISGVTLSGATQVYVLGTGQLGTEPSSARFKQDIENMGEASDVLLSLRPVTFHYKANLDPQGLAQFGLIAEEVDKLNPDLVVRDSKNQTYSVRYEAVNAMLLNEFLKQHRKVEEQAREIVALKKKADKMDLLEERLNELQALVKQSSGQK